MIAIILITLIITVLATLSVLCLIMRCNDIVVARTKQNTLYSGYFVLINKNSLYEHKGFFEEISENEMFKEITLMNLVRFIYSENLSTNIFK